MLLTDKQRKQAVAANSRGRRHARSLADLEKAAGAMGERAVVEMALSRQNQRWGNLRDTSQFLTAASLDPLKRLPYLDWLIEKAREMVGPGNDSELGQILQIVHDGIDAIYSYSRHMMMVSPVGAAAIARHALERWTGNIEFSHGRAPAGRTPTREDIDRAWQQTNGHMTRMFAIWCDALHSRQIGLDLTRWDAIDLCKCEMPGQSNAWFASFTTFALGNIGRWLEQTLYVYCRDTPELKGLVADPNAVAIPPNLSVFPDYLSQLYLFPLLLHTCNRPEFNSGPASQSAYPLLLRSIDQWPPKHGGALLMYGFANRRCRAARQAGRAFQAESVQLGDRFSPGRLMNKDIHKAVICETAAIVAKFDSRPGAQYLAYASSALRSAYALWLEDDSQSVTCVRSALEAVAKARAWRLKPPRAAELDSWPSQAGRWLELAGLKRLKPIFSVAGSFAHFAGVDPADKIKSLGHFVEQAGDGVDPRRVARGHLRFQAEAMLAIELTYWLATDYPATAAALWSALGATVATAERANDRWLNMVWNSPNG